MLLPLLLLLLFRLFLLLLHSLLRVTPGEFCTECDHTQGLVMTDEFECSTCMNPILLATLCLLAAFVGLFGIIYLILSTRKSEQPSYVSIVFKIIFSGFQVNSAALSFAFKWDVLTETMLKIEAQVGAIR